MTQEDRYDKVISAIRAKAKEGLPEGSEVTSKRRKISDNRIQVDILD